MIYSDGTSSAETIAAYKAGVFTAGTIAPRDAASVSENPTFTSTAGSSPNFLHINSSTPTQIESGAANIATFTNDYDGDVRHGNPGYAGTGTAPDMGADEGNFTLAIPKAVGTIVYNQASTSNVNLNSSNNPILRIDIPVTGSTGTLNLNSLVVTSLNTNDADVSASGVKLYRTSTTTFSTANPLGTAQSFSGGTATFSSLGYDLPTGTTYVWVTYDIAGSATVSNTADAKIVANAIDVAGSTYPAADESPVGSRTIADDKTLASLTVTQASTSSITKGSSNNEVLLLDFNVSGTTSTLPLNSIVVNYTGTTATDIATSGVKLYRTATNTFGTANPLGTAQSLSGGNATFGSLSYDLPSGHTYIWIALDVTAGSTSYDAVDAQISANAIDVSSVTYPSTLQNPTGTRSINPVTISSFPWTETFSSAALPVDWSRNHTGTTTYDWDFVTSNTHCASTDHTTGSGYYAHLYSFIAPTANNPYNLITPPFDLSSGGKHLEYYAWIGSAAASNPLYVEISTDNQATWTVLRAHDLTTTGSWFKNELDLSSYASTNAFIRFRGISNYGSGTCDFGIDDAKVFTSIPMTISSSTTTQSVTSSVGIGATNQQIVGIEIVTTGNSSPLQVTQFDLSTNGSTNASDIANAKLYSTGTSSTFATATQFGSTVANPSVAFSITSMQSLAEGTNYFWLTYDVSGSATGGDVLDAECSQITVSANTYAPTVQAPVGSRGILSALSGSYTVGTALFNKVTCRNITIEQRTRTVTREVQVEQTQTTKVVALVVGNENAKPEYRTEAVEETYGVLMENGQPYVGPRFAPIHTQAVEKREPNSTDNPLGVYTTITDAIADLNLRGVSGAVQFLLTDASYAGEALPITINAVAGASATNTVTLRPNTGVTSTISGSGTAIFKLNGADYVTIDGSNSGGTSRDLTITNTSTSGTIATIWLVSQGADAGASNNVIKNCNINTGNNTSSIYGIAVGGSTIGSQGADNDNVTIQNNVISKAYVGIYAQGSATANPGLMDNLQIIGNSIGSATVSDYIGHDGVIVANITGGTVSGNTIYNIITSATTPVGLTLSTGVVSSTVSGNNVNSVTYTGTGGWGGRGIYVSTGNATSGLVITNNVISAIGGDGWTSFSGSSPVGIYFDGTTGGLIVYYNSVCLSGDLTKNSATVTAAVLFNTATVTSVDLRNNIFRNSMNNTANSGAKNYSIYSTAAPSTFTNIDYNDYYVSGTQGVLGYIGGADKTTLGAWQTATAKDASSVSGDPGFTSITDLHIDVANANSWNVNGRGVAIASVTTDYDGNSRSVTAGTPTDIGADEFTPSATPPDATSSGAPATGTTTTYTSGGRIVAEITWQTGLAAPAEVPSAVTVKYFPGVPPPGAVNANINSYWDITATGGSGYSCDVVLHYTPAELNNISELSLYMGKTDAANAWRLVEPSIPNEVANTVTGLDVTSFSKFTLTDVNNALPVQITSFTALEIPNRGVKLEWRTISEVNNYGFFVQRKAESAGSWSEVPNSFVAGHGTTNEPQQYEFMDHTVSVGSWLYRLRQVDLDSTSHFTEPIRVGVVTSVREVAPMQFALKQNYPNPFNPETTIKFSVENTERATIEIYNILGQKVATLFDDVAEAGFYYKVKFNANSLASGVYLYRLQSGKKNDLKKLLLLK
ncbi:MAG: T9SS type A sorting domain-containing protein [Ignavibacteriae bacterium]|nr:T9SS type A sorting domain-containing protein [Ignavibacteriota bacterium]